MKRESFIFYRSFYESLQELPDQERLEVLDGIIEYALNDEEPAGSGIVKALFVAFKPQLDANDRKYENGLKGGRPKKPNQNQTETKAKPNHNQGITKAKPNHNQTITKPKPNDNDNVNDNVNVNDNENENEKGNDNVSGSAALHTDIDSLSLSLLSFLNDKTGSHYKLTDDVRALIEARVSEGYGEADFRQVIENKSAEWSCDGKMRAYIRPSTLFGPKFEEYLNAPPPIVEEKPRGEDPHKRLDELKLKRASLVATGASREELEVIDLNIASLEDALEAKNG